jgi:hypothetical protein
MQGLIKKQGIGCLRHPLGHPNGTWVFPFAPGLTTIRVCRFMQLNLAGLVLATLTICNRRVQVANLIGFEAVNFVPSADIGQ